MAIYIDFNKKSTKGNVTAKGFENCIEIDNFNFGCGRSVSMEAGAMANRECSKPNLSEVSFSKRLDAASGGIFKTAVTGDEGVPVTIYVVQTGAAGVEKYCEWKLENCIISSYSVSASSGGAPTENISLSYAKIEADLSYADKTNKNTKNMRVGYDLTLGTAL